MNVLNFKNKILGTFSLEVAGASWGCSLLLLFKCCSESSTPHGIYMWPGRLVLNSVYN